MWIKVFPVSVGLLICPDEKMSGGCVCMHGRATRASWLLNSAGQSCAGLLWKIIASPYTPATSTFRTTKGVAKGCSSPHTEVGHIKFLQLIWPQFGWLWIFDALMQCTDTSLELPVPIPAVVDMSWTSSWSLLDGFHAEMWCWRISLVSLWTHNHRTAIFEVGPS